MPPFDYAGPLELSYPLPAWEGADRPMLELGGPARDAGGALLDGEPFQRIPAGMGWAYVTLPGDCARVTLRLDKRAEDAMPFLLPTDSATVLEQARADTSLLAFPAATFAVVFLLALGLFLYGWQQGTPPWPALLLSAAALGQTAYFYLQNLPLSALPPGLYGLALWQSRALLFAAPLLFLLLGMKKRRRAFAPFAVLPALIYWVVAGFQTAAPLFSSIAIHAGVPYCLTAATLLVCAALEYHRDGNPVFRRFLPWLGVCAAAAVWCAVSLVRTGALPPTLEMFLQDPLFCWNSLLLALCLLESVTNQIRRMAQQETALQMLSARESLMREQLATVRESAASLRALRHDVKTLYLVLQNLYRAGEGARKWLRVDLHIWGVHLYIGVENSRFAPVDYDGESGLYRTTKADKSAHGYGLKAVRAVARKYRSELVLQFPEGSFSAATALQMPD